METRQLTAEHRSVLEQRGMLLNIPQSTPAHIRARLVAGLIATAEARTVSAQDERSYQIAAARYVRPQSDIQSQIAAWNQRQAVKRKTVADVRSLAARAPELSLEDLSRCLRLQYSEDTILALRSAAIGRTIRQGFAFEAEPMRSEDGGAVSDPQQSLRDAVTYHRNCASKAKSMNACVAHHKAADEAERKLKG